MQLSCNAKAPVASVTSGRKAVAGNVHAVRPTARPAVRCVAIAQVIENRKGGLVSAGLSVLILCVSKAEPSVRNFFPSQLARLGRVVAAAAAVSSRNRVASECTSTMCGLLQAANIVAALDSWAAWHNSSMQGHQQRRASFATARHDASTPLQPASLSRHMLLARCVPPACRSPPAAATAASAAAWPMQQLLRR